MGAFLEILNGVAGAAGGIFGLIALVTLFRVGREAILDRLISLALMSVIYWNPGQIGGFAVIVYFVWEIKYAGGNLVEDLFTDVSAFGLLVLIVSNLSKLWNILSAMKTFLPE